MPCLNRDTEQGRQARLGAPLRELVSREDQGLLLRAPQRYRQLPTRHERVIQSITGVYMQRVRNCAKEHFHRLGQG